MTDSTYAIPRGAIKRNLKRLVDHWGFISVVLTGIGTLFGFAILYVYFKAIGLPELFSSALDTKTALIPWMLLVALLLFLYTFILCMNSIIFGSGAATFNKQPSTQRWMVILLFVPICLGILVLITGIVSDLSPPITLAASVAAGAIGLGVPMCFKKFRVVIHISGFMAQPERGDTWQASYGPLIPLFVVVLSSVITAIFPMQLVLSSYTTSDGIKENWWLIGMGASVACLALVPAIIFFTVGKNLLSRMKYALVTLAALLIFMLLLAPRTLPMIVYRAAFLAGLRDTTISSFLITETYSDRDFDSDWGVIKTVDNHPVLRAFPLLSLGDLLVLCPASLVKTELEDWPKVSHACLITDSKIVKRLPEKQAEKRRARIRLYDV